MGEEISNTVNLDLNLGPGPEVTNASAWANGPLNGESEPLRRRVESLRTTLERSGYVRTEGIRQRESRTGETPARQFLSRVMTSRGVRSEQNQSSAPLDGFRQMGAAPPTPVMSLQRQMMQAALDLRLPFSPVLTAAERLEDAYLMRHTFDEQLNNVPSVGGEDRDSFSSIIGVMNSESQVDTAAEIDSMVTVSTSSSVRRPHENNGSRVSDVDSADSRPLRRRRLA
ncbi:hypothetical protein F2Q68_00023800 [Brassica cretica]|uniref:Uncharacterized protein n=1 Tax=Brassica cretica TaxID=69181 RepID=A0A8S9IFQ8_BRACR|nr:hypothetical protein F2Q68_00023800 [Brassica cretica]